MTCPLCTDQMLQPRRRGDVEIDVCPHCHGIWLDRGEIEKLLGRDDIVRQPATPQPERAAAGAGPEVWSESKKKKKKRQKSLGERLGDLLEDALDL